MQDYEDRYCPIAKNEIGSEICYEIIMCLYNGFSPYSVPEVEFKNDKETKELCRKCKHSDWC